MIQLSYKINCEVDDIKEFVISIGTLIAVIVIGFFGSKFIMKITPENLVLLLTN